MSVLHRAHLGNFHYLNKEQHFIFGMNLMLDEFLSFAYLQNLIFRGNDVALQFLQVAQKTLLLNIYCITF